MFFSNRDVLRVSLRYDVVTNIRGNRLNSAEIAQELITINKITARKLRNQLRIS